MYDFEGVTRTYSIGREGETMKSIVLCADDYGQAIFISKAIIELVMCHRLSATSCIVNGVDWRTQASWLFPFREEIEIGLHLNLTEGEALSTLFKNYYGKNLFSLPILMQKIFFHRLDLTVIQAECEAQLNHFYEAFGFLPHFIDGHQHVHHFPIVREALMHIYAQYFHSYRPYIRWVNERVRLIDWIFHFKKIIIHQMGVSPFKKLLDHYRIPHNQSFCGIYTFSNIRCFRSLFLRFLKEIGSGGIIMCHPAFLVPHQRNSFIRTRYKEYQYFMSQRFLEDLQAAEVILNCYKTKL